MPAGAVPGRAGKGRSFGAFAGRLRLPGDGAGAANWAMPGRGQGRSFRLPRGQAAGSLDGAGSGRERTLHPHAQDADARALGNLILEYGWFSCAAGWPKACGSAGSSLHRMVFARRWAGKPEGILVVRAARRGWLRRALIRAGLCAMGAAAGKTQRRERDRPTRSGRQRCCGLRPCRRSGESGAGKLR